MRSAPQAVEKAGETCGSQPEVVVVAEEEFEDVGPRNPGGWMLEPVNDEK